MEKKNKITTVSLEQLRQEEMDLADQLDEGQDFSDLNAEEELNFESVQEREYEPEVWEVENDDADTSEESV